MHSYRIVVRSPHVCRVVRPTVGARSLALFTATQHVPHFPSTISRGNSLEITPLFRLMDEIATFSRSLDVSPQPSTRRVIPFQPRFDVRELGDSYELRGEVPDVDSNDLQVEFIDAQTLVIRGNTQTGDNLNVIKTQVTEPAAGGATEFTESIATPDKSDTASTHSSSYQKATVEDEETIEASKSTSAHPTSIEPNAYTTQQSAAESGTKPASQSNRKSYHQQSRYWVSERTTGNFQRVFKFASRINQEEVKASLRSGILNITVPKAAAHTIKKINIE